MSVYRLMSVCWSTLKYNAMFLKRPFYTLASDKTIKYICMENFKKSQHINTIHYRAKFKNQYSNAAPKRLSSQNWTRTWTLHLKKKDPLIHGYVGKTEPWGLKYYSPNLLLVKPPSTKIILFPVIQRTSACPCSFELVYVSCTVQKFYFSCLLSLSCIVLFWIKLFHITEGTFFKKADYGHETSYTTSLFTFFHNMHPFSG